MENITREIKLEQDELDYIVDLIIDNLEKCEDIDHIAAWIKLYKRLREELEEGWS